MEGDRITEDELQLRLERELLLMEKEFLLREMEVTSALTTRVTTARRSASETDEGLLRAYLNGLRLRDMRACCIAEDGMRAKVEAEKRRLNDLKRILSALRMEAVKIQKNCAGI